MTKILLLGCDGQVGWELARSLLPLGQVLAFNQRDLNLTDSGAIHRVVAHERPDFIVNAAGYTNVDRAEQDYDTARRVNADGPAALAQAASRNGATLVHFSTDYVFDGRGTGPYEETDVPAPLNRYGETKLAGELAVRDSGAAHLILRTSWVYGMRRSNFLLSVLKLALERGELTIVDDQFGAPTWCRLIADTTAQILARISTQMNTVDSGVYHLTASGVTSWYGFACAILANTQAGNRAQAQRPPQVRAITSAEFPTAAIRPNNSRLSCVRLERDFDLRLPDWRHCLDLCMQT